MAFSELGRNERIEQMALRTWEAIGGDILRCLEEMNKTPIMTREEVIESVCDAGYMKMYGNDKVAYEEWDNLPNYEAKMEAVRPAFTFEKYGW